MSELPPPSVPPPPPAPPASGSSDRNIMLFLAYFGIFALIPLLMKKDDPDLQWHSKNGLAYAVAWFVCAMAVNILSIFMPGIMKLVVSGLGCIIGLGFFVGWILALVKAFKGERMIFPVITELVEKM